MSEERQALVRGATRFIAIVGDPISQVLSPEIYNPRLVKANALLLPLHVPSSTFETVMPSLRRIANLAGLVFTVPFKERAIPFADEVLPAGRQIGAINAMRPGADGRWTADMFDGTGLVRALERLDATPAGRRVLLIGAGGAGRAIAIALARARASALTIFDVDQGKLKRLADDVRRFYPTCAITTPERVDAARHDIVINATPVGMTAGDGFPAPLGALDSATVVFDIVPTPTMTPLMAHAAAAGCRTGGGRLMIESQAEAVLEFLGFVSSAPSYAHHAK